MADAEVSGNHGTDPISAFLKLASGLSYLQSGNPVKLVFAPDAVRDTTISINDPERFYKDALDKETTKNRFGLAAKIGIGGHGAIGALGAGMLRGDRESVDVTLIAKVFEGAREEIVNQLINGQLESKGAAPINTDYILEQRPSAGTTNIVLETPTHTTIGVSGDQPRTRLEDLPSKEAVVSLLSGADVCGILSLKSPFMNDVLVEMAAGNISLRELVSDVTTGDYTEDMVSFARMLQGSGGQRVPITLLSLNDEETVRYAKILRDLEADPEKISQFLESGEYLEAKQGIKRWTDSLRQLEKENASPERLAETEAKIKECEKTLKDMSSGFESTLAVDETAGWSKNPVEAARYVNSRIFVPLLFHMKTGSQMIDGEKQRESEFVPSISIHPRAGTLGAGDTMLGSLMLSIAVKKRLEAEGAPMELQMSWEDCLMVANATTCYRLEHEKSAGTMNEIFAWLNQNAREVNMPGLESADDLAKIAYERFSAYKAAKGGNFSKAEIDKLRQSVGKFLAERYYLECAGERVLKNGQELGNGDSGNEFFDEDSRFIINAAGSSDQVFSAAAQDLLRAIAAKYPKFSAAVRRELGIKEKRIAVLLDLDGTLFDSRESRERAGTIALSKMGLMLNVDKPMDRESAGHFFKAIYASHAYFTKAGLPDFRKVWNSKEFYAAALVLAREYHQNYVTEAWDRHIILGDKGHFMYFVQNLKNGSNEFANSNYWQLLRQRIKITAEDPGNHDMITGAVEAFEKAGLKPFADAKRILSLFRDVLGAELYVVTEGHDPTQLKKIRLLGLANFFNCGRNVLTNDLVASKWQVGPELRFEKDMQASRERDAVSKNEQTVKDFNALTQKHMVERTSIQKEDIEQELNNLLKTSYHVADATAERNAADAAIGLLERRMKTASSMECFYPYALWAIGYRGSYNPRQEFIGAHPEGIIYDAGRGNDGILAIFITDRTADEAVAMRKSVPETVTFVLQKGQYSDELGNLRKAIEKANANEAENAEETLRNMLKTDKTGGELISYANNLLPQGSGESLSKIAGMVFSGSLRSNSEPVHPLKCLKTCENMLREKEEPDALIIRESKVVRGLAKNLLTPKDIDRVFMEANRQELRFMLEEKPDPEMFRYAARCIMRRIGNFGLEGKERLKMKKETAAELRKINPNNAKLKARQR